jgi:hypothetical protein
LPKRTRTPKAFEGVTADLRVAVSRWLNRERRREPNRFGHLLNEESVFFLALCARYPHFIAAPKNSAASIAFNPSSEHGDGLTAEQRSLKLAGILASNPDEAFAFLAWFRESVVHRKPTMLGEARRAVREFAFDARSSGTNVNRAQIVEHLKSRDVDFEGRKKPRFWDGHVDDAIKAEQGYLQRKTTFGKKIVWQDKTPNKGRKRPRKTPIEG